jgi:hypothetical protein
MRTLLFMTFLAMATAMFEAKAATIPNCNKLPVLVAPLPTLTQHDLMQHDADIDARIVEEVPHEEPAEPHEEPAESHEEPAGPAEPREPIHFNPPPERTAPNEVQFPSEPGPEPKTTLDLPSWAKRAEKVFERARPSQSIPSNIESHKHPAAGIVISIPVAVLHQDIAIIGVEREFKKGHGLGKSMLANGDTNVIVKYDDGSAGQISTSEYQAGNYAPPLGNLSWAIVREVECRE